MTERISWLAHQTLRSARKVFIGMIGGTVLLFGLVLLITPGPAFVVIPIGLAILAVEFAWARHWLHRLTGRAPTAEHTSSVTPPGQPDETSRGH